MHNARADEHVRMHVQSGVKIVPAKERERETPCAKRHVTHHISSSFLALNYAK